MLENIVQTKRNISKCCLEILFYFSCYFVLFLKKTKFVLLYSLMLIHPRWMGYKTVFIKTTKPPLAANQAVFFVLQDLESLYCLQCMNNGDCNSFYYLGSSSSTCLNHLNVVHSMVYDGVVAEKNKSLKSQQLNAAILKVLVYFDILNLLINFLFILIVIYDFSLSCSTDDLFRWLTAHRLFIC